MVKNFTFVCLICSHSIGLTHIYKMRGEFIQNILLPVFIFKQSVGIRFLEQNFFLQDFQKPLKSFLHKSEARSSLNSKSAAKIASLIANLYLNLALMRSSLMLPDRRQPQFRQICTTEMHCCLSSSNSKDHQCFIWWTLGIQCTVCIN